jgi:hypothetical protein
MKFYSLLLTRTISALFSLGTLLTISVQALSLAPELNTPLNKGGREQRSSNLVAINWPDLFRRNNQDTEGVGPPFDGTGRGELCLISPKKQEKIWSDRPFFLWRPSFDPRTEEPIGTVTQVEVRSNFRDADTIVWTGTPTDSNPIYDYLAYDGDTKLEPGQTYFWLIFLDGATGEDWIAFSEFQVMPSEERDPIVAELQALTDRLTAEGADAETLAFERAKYFADKQLFADALQEAYSVAEPSAELMELRQTLPAELFDRRCSSI